VFQAIQATTPSHAQGVEKSREAGQGKGQDLEVGREGIDQGAGREAEGGEVGAAAGNARFTLVTSATALRNQSLKMSLNIMAR